MLLEMNTARGIKCIYEPHCIITQDILLTTCYGILQLTATPFIAPPFSPIINPSSMCKLYLIPPSSTMLRPIIRIVSRLVRKSQRVKILRRNGSIEIPAFLGLTVRYR
jgi:hypothetical protein